MNNILSSNTTTRKVICGNSLNLLNNYENVKAIITSLPDMEEIGETKIYKYHLWLFVACEKLRNSIDENGVIFFYQTNRKYKGTLIDKNSLITSQFIPYEFNKVFEKIILRKEPETIDRYRPTYTTLTAFSKTLKAGQPTPDIIHRGNMMYKNAMGENAIKVCLDFVKKNVETDTILDPFCGRGSVLRLANFYGYNAIGIDIDPKQCEIAKNI